MGEKSMIDLDNLLIEAMNSELEAKRFYDDASIKAQSQAGKKLFKELAEFEQNHYNRVKNIIESRTNRIEFEKSTATQNIPIINSEIEGELEPNKSEIVIVVNLAIEAEKKAQERYKKIAEMLDDDESKQIFYNLSQDERNHQRILEDEFYQLSNKGTIIWE
jgi:rubrerythrin